MFEPNAMPKLLFCCMGNICRSPTAEAVFRQRAAAAGLMVSVDSAGTHGYHVGEPPDARSQHHAARRGYDLSALRARQVQVEDFQRFDLVLAMDGDNLEHLARICPAEYHDKLVRLLHYSRLAPEGDVPDPYYGGAAGFERVLDLIEDASDGLIAALKSGAIRPSRR